MFQKLEASHSLIYPHTKLKPPIQEAHADHELLLGTAAIYTQGVQNQLEHMVSFSSSLPGGSRGQRQFSPGPLQGLQAVICKIKSDFKMIFHEVFNSAMSNVLGL